METSVFIAKILGPVFLIIATSILLNRDFYLKVMDDYYKNSSLAFFLGTIPIVLGIAVVLKHNIWTPNWQLIITIFGWGGILKGAWLLLFPKNVMDFMKIYHKHKNLIKLQAVLILIFGISLSYFAYFCL